MTSDEIDAAGVLDALVGMSFDEQWVMRQLRLSGGSMMFRALFAAAFKRNKPLKSPFLPVINSDLETLLVDMHDEGHLCTRVTSLHYTSKGNYMNEAQVNEAREHGVISLTPLPGCKECHAK